MLALAAGPVLNALALGDDVARSLGSGSGWPGSFAATSVVLLPARPRRWPARSASSAWTIPHVARAITGPDYRWLLPYSMLLAPSCCSAPTSSAGSSPARASSRSGIVTAVVGAPFFIFLVRRRRLAEL